MSALILAHTAGSTLTIASQRVETSWQWYVIRAAGFVSAGLLVLLMLSGVGQVTGLTYKLIEPVKAWALHKAMAIALCISLSIHILFLLVDKFIPFDLLQITLPFLSHVNNGSSLPGLALGSLAVSFGILAMYGVVIIVLSSLGWIDTHQKAWRRLHYISYAVMGLVFLHVLYVGTDFAHGVWRQLWLGAAIFILIGLVLRLRRAGSLGKIGSE